MIDNISKYMDKENWKKEYLNNQVIDCPWCEQDRPNHSCENCYSDMSQENCWKWQGCCSEKCLKYLTEELPRLRQGKIDAGIKCLCEEPTCAKCLSINCKDKNCPTHTREAKKEWQRKWEIGNKKPWLGPKNY